MTTSSGSNGHKVQAVIFDVDGTLIDSVDLHAKAWQDALQEFGKDVSFEEARFQIGKGGDQLMPVFLSEEEVKESGEKLAARRGEIFKEKYLPKIQKFEKQTSSDDAEKSKPFPDIFAAALERLGNPPVEETIVVGDTPYDIEAAGKINLRTIGMRCGGFPEETLKDAIAVYDDPADLLARYDESPLGGG
jgi:phosphoglycolate phosphatase-like HAD superfamily hydrolase